jgi:hypothetical protein
VQAVETVAVVKRLVRNGWVRLLVVDPETSSVSLYDEGEWCRRVYEEGVGESLFQELCNP